MSSLRVRLLVPLVVVALPLTLLTILAVRWDQERQQREVGERATAVAETAGIVLGHALVGGENLLDSLDGHARLRTGGSTCSTLLFEIRSAGDRYASIGVAGADGEVICASPVPTGTVSLADRGYVTRAMETGAFSVGDLQVGRLSGIPTIAFARPTSVAPGGVLFASIDLNWLVGLLEPLAVREEVVLLFAGRDGGLIATAGAPTGAVADELVVRSLEAEARGSNVAASGRDEYLIGTAQLDIRAGGQEVGTVIAAVPRGPIVAAGERSLLLALTVLGLTATAGLAGAFLLNERLILAPIRRLRDAAAGMRDGNLDLRLHDRRTGEIGELEHALDQAATEIAEGRAAIANVAFVDHLTGSATRQGLEREAERLGAEGRPFGILYATAVGFHQLTATFGYPAADEALRVMSARLSTLPDATTGRVGGNAFAVLLPTSAEQPDVQMRQTAARVLELFRQPVDVGRVPLQISMLLGGALSPAHGTDFDLLLRRAEVAAREARGEAGSLLYDPARHEPRVNNVSVLAELRRAMEEDELELHYQPVVDLQDGTTAKVEALLRWPTAPPAARSPEVFIPLAERSGMIGPLDRWVVERATRQSAAWEAERGRVLRIAVNISAHSIQDASFPDFVGDLLTKHRVQPSSLTLEITETALVTYFDDALDVCRRLRALGLTISVDDFGIGHSPVLYLRDFPVSEIKVDRSLIREAPTDRGVATIVRALTAMAAGLGVATVAEGVETEEQRATARDLGCETAQGWLYAPALSPAEAVRWDSQRSA